MGFIRGDHRALLQMLGATDKNEITYHRTFNVRHNLSIVKIELVKFLCFLVRVAKNEAMMVGLMQHETIQQFKSIINDSVMMNVHENSLVIPYLLTTCVTEVLSNDLDLSFVSLCIISRMCRLIKINNDIDGELELAMISCGSVASNIGTAQSYLRTAVCSYSLLRKLSPA